VPYDPYAPRDWHKAFLGRERSEAARPTFVENISMPEETNATVSAEVTEVVEEVSTPAVVARRMADLLVAGKDPDDYVPEDLRLHKGFKRELQKLITAGYVPADLMRAAVRAGRNTMFMQLLGEGLAAEDTDTKVSKLKLALDTSKVIGADPEIGLNQPPGVQVNINIEDVKDILEKMD